jgi:hypothetical protein
MHTDPDEYSSQEEYNQAIKDNRSLSMGELANAYVESLDKTNYKDLIDEYKEWKNRGRNKKR